jgi:hypothetical protein
MYLAAALTSLFTIPLAASVNIPWWGQILIAVAPVANTILILRVQRKELRPMHRTVTQARNTSRQAAAKSSEAVAASHAATEASQAAAEASEYVARTVKESHNNLIDELSERRKYEDAPDSESHKFLPRRHDDT